MVPVNASATRAVLFPHAHARPGSRMTDADTADVIARAGAGDAAAFEALVRRHHATVFRWAFAATGDRDDAEDLAQAVWIKVHRSLGSYRGNAAFTTWLYRITFNAGFEFRRTRDRRSEALANWSASTEQPAQVAEVPGEVEGTRLADVVQRLLKDLPPRQRAVFALADLEGRSSAEIAAMLEIEEVTGEPICSRPGGRFGSASCWKNRS